MGKEYKVADLATELGIVVKTVYRMIERKDIDPANVKEKYDNNRKVTVITLEPSELEALKKKYGKLSDNTPVNEVENGSHCNNNLQSQNSQNADALAIINKLTDNIIDLQGQLNIVSQGAGQTKLLTDNLMSKEKDLDYWKEQYFKLQYENEQLKKENEELKARKWWRFK